MCANHTCLIMVPIGIIYILWDNQKYVRTLGTVPHASKWKNRCIFRGLVLKFQYKVCHMSAHHVCLINMLFGYIFKLLCSIKVCAPMWHILWSLNHNFLHFFGQNAIFCSKKICQNPPILAHDFEVPKFYVLVTLWPSSARTRYIRYWRTV